MRSLKKLLTSATMLAFSAGITLGAVVTTAGAAMRGSAVFPDVTQGSYYDDAIGIMYGEGIITGYADGKFGPDDPVTRGQMAVIMQRLMLEIGAIDESGSSSSRSRSSSSRSSEDDEDEEEEEDDDVYNDNGAFRFTTLQFDVSEASAKASVTVIRSEGDDGKVTVGYETVDDTATTGEDYTANSGTLTFEDGETSKTITVNLKNDDKGEDTEAFKIKLKNPTGGSELSSDSTVTIRILDNDGGAGSSSSSAGSSTASVGSAGAVGFGGSAYAVEEDIGTFTVYVNRTGGTKGAVSVSYETKNGTAADGGQFNRSSGTLSFSDGETQKSFTVQILDDGETKGNKTFSMVLTSPTGGAVLAKNANVVVTIVDNEAIQTGSGTFRLGEDEIEVYEGETAYIPVERVSGTATEMTLKYEALNGSAQSGGDFLATTGTLTFKPGEAEKLVEVKVLKDDKSDEYNEKFTVRISEPSNGGSLGVPSTAGITIYE